MIRIIAMLLLLAVGFSVDAQLRPQTNDKTVLQGNPYRSPWLDFGGTITATGTPQALMPADPNRTGYFVQNQSTHVLTLNIPAASGLVTHLQIPVGAYYESPWISTPTTAITIQGTAGDAFACGEW